MGIIYWNVKAIHAIIFLWSYLTFAQFLKSGTMQQHNANTFGASIIYNWLSYLVDYPNKNFLYSNEVHFLISLLESLRLTQNAHDIQAFASTPDALLRLQLEYTRLFIQDGKRPAAGLYNKIGFTVIVSIQKCLFNPFRAHQSIRTRLFIGIWHIGDASSYKFLKAV